MSTLHCPLCGLRFRFGSELDVHAREDHAPQRLQHLVPPRPREESEREERVLRLPW